MVFWFSLRNQNLKKYLAELTFKINLCQGYRGHLGTLCIVHQVIDTYVVHIYNQSEIYCNKQSNCSELIFKG